MDRYQAPKRNEERIVGDERTQLNLWLDFYRSTLLLKCNDLDEEQLRIRPVATSRLSLLGLVQHMSLVELYWFSHVLSDVQVANRFADENDDEDADFNDLESYSPEEIFEFYMAALDTARTLVSGIDLSSSSKRERHGESVDLRWIYIHMIEEYARHCGHADLIRELIDGEVSY